MHILSVAHTFLAFIVIQRITAQELYDGDSCLLENGKKGVCKLLSQCPERRIEAETGKRGPMSRRCGWRGQEEVVCCPSALKDEIVTRLADSACEKYKKNATGLFKIQVVHGLKASAIDFPYMAALGYVDWDKSSNDGLKYACGGTIVSPDYVLTAAHCVKNIGGNVPIVVRVGSEDLSENSTRVRQVQISKIISHPEYKLSAIYNDIALLKLETPLEWTNTIRPICLNTNGANDENIKSYSTLLVAGWGATDIDAELSSKLLRSPALNLVSRSECEKAYTGFRQVSNGLDERTICAIDRNESRRSDACQGDSGGPLVMMTFGSATLIGITSFGQTCGGPTPGVYTSIYSFLDWIESIVWPKRAEPIWK